MSYILDALRKSDLQRRRGTAPTLLAVQEPAPERKRPGLLTYGLLAAVLIGAGIVIGWMRPWQSEQAVPVRPEPVAAKPLESAPIPSTPDPARAPFETAPQPKPELNLQNATQPKLKRTTKPERSARAQPAIEGLPREAGAPSTSAAPSPEQQVATAAADAASEQTVISMAELPSFVRAELPAMTISVHAYSGDPAGRLLGIGNQILREGDFVAPGVKLVEITPEGMVLDYKGYRFHRGVK
jgi:general secretion pathway protein B